MPPGCQSTCSRPILHRPPGQTGARHATTPSSSLPDQLRRSCTSTGLPRRRAKSRASQRRPLDERWAEHSRWRRHAMHRQARLMPFAVWRWYFSRSLMSGRPRSKRRCSTPMVLLARGQVVAEQPSGQPPRAPNHRRAKAPLGRNDADAWSKYFLSSKRPSGTVEAYIGPSASRLKPRRAQVGSSTRPSRP